MRQRLTRIAARTRDHGPAYTALDVAHRLSERAQRRALDALLVQEQRRGELGPAHRAWRGNSAAENQERWDGWDWSRYGEEWTESEEWKQSLVEDVLRRELPPGGTVLEIGPGAGRWTEHLLERHERVIAVDVSRTPLRLLVERFGESAPLTTIHSPGSSFPGVEDASVDAAWSFDVLVHVAPTDVAGYLDELARVLRPGAPAVLHHADGRNRGQLPSRRGWRAPMGRVLFANLARERGFDVARQLDRWGPGGRHGLDVYGDVITVLHRR